MADKKAVRDIRVVVMGAGMAGILSGIKLLEAGITNCAIYEKADRIGGTWRENTYPGLTCDVPSHAYTYSFEPNPDWSHMLPPGAEIQEYFERTTRKYGVDKIIRFNEEIVRCEFRGGRWHLETKNATRGQTRRAGARWAAAPTPSRTRDAAPARMASRSRTARRATRRGE